MKILESNISPTSIYKRKLNAPVTMRNFIYLAFFLFLKKGNEKRNGPDFIFIITNLTVPTVNQYFPKMLLVSH